MSDMDCVAMKIFGLSKAERVHGNSAVDDIFGRGRRGYAPPFKYVWTADDAEAGNGGAAVLFSVPKRQLKRAVWRNVIKRRAREAYRLNKQIVTQPAAECGKRVAIALIYIGKEIADYNSVEHGVKKALEQIAGSL